jgi:ketosteroid isomerase-like protein
MQSSAVDAALAFVDRINHRDPAGLAALMTEDHRFVDGLGQTVHGRGAMEAGWRGYFGAFPDYSITVENILSDGDVVAMFGTARGSQAAHHWQIPAAWKAVVRHGRVAEWRVYADNEPVWKAMGVKRY